MRRWMTTHECKGAGSTPHLKDEKQTVLKQYVERKGKEEIQKASCENGTQQDGDSCEDGGVRGVSSIPAPELTMTSEMEPAQIWSAKWGNVSSDASSIHVSKRNLFNEKVVVIAANKCRHTTTHSRTRIFDFNHLKGFRLRFLWFLYIMPQWIISIGYFEFMW